MVRTALVLCLAVGITIVRSGVEVRGIDASVRTDGIKTADIETASIKTEYPTAHR